jgi:hypothetical protein
MSEEATPDHSFFIDILQTLERIEAPYMIIGAFAGIIYGISRVTYDIDIVVNLGESHLNQLAANYPVPRYYADPEMMRNSIRLGIMFNIIDTERGEKADLVPLSGSPYARDAFERRVRQLIEIPGQAGFEVWIAQSEDVILGKLMAWQEGRSRKHETDIYEMMVFHYLGEDPVHSAEFDEGYIDMHAAHVGLEALQLWQQIKSGARKQADELRNQGSDTPQSTLKG